ncbi:hypothetical protein BKA57DRAFT_491798 [Linnemannia elongata]|nr:hypothetical protein BKA57DRAFT_491798 [Linnemannia elongata]
MGVVDLDCIASNPNSTILYGIGNAEDGFGAVRIIIYRSHENLANSTDIIWEEHQRFYQSDTEPHYKYPRFGDVDCAVSSKGEFTAFLYNPQVSATGYSRPIPMGIRSKPDGARGNLKEDEEVIWGSMVYGWTSRKFVHQSFYIEKNGVETVVHAVMDETASVIRFGLVDKDTGYLQLAAVWKLVRRSAKLTTTEFSPGSSSLINTDQRHMVYQNGSLYLYSDTTGLISSIPFSSPFTTPSQKDLFQATPITANRRNMFFQGMRDNSPYIGYLARLDTYNEAGLATTMTMRLSTIELANPSNLINTTNGAITNTSTKNFEMESGGSHQRVINFQTGAGRFPDQMPFIVGLTTDGYFGITLGSGPPTTIPVENFTAPINEVQVTLLRSRLRNYRGQVGPIIYNETVELSGLEIFGVVMGVIFGIPLLRYLVKKFDKWLEKIRLDDEKRAADKEAYELIARLRHASAQYSTNPSSTTTAIGGGEGTRGLSYRSTSANTTSHALMDDLGLTRHPRPNTAITIGDDEDESTQGRVDTQQ